MAPSRAGAKDKPWTGVTAALDQGNRRLLSRLSRTTSSGEFIPEVDGLRFIAIAAVVLHHLMASYLRTSQRLGAVDLPAQWWDVFPRSGMIALAYAGHFGVHLFFVISGFVLALPFVRSYRKAAPRPHLGAYYVRRLIRLEPPYIVNICVAFGIIVLTNDGWRSFIPHFPASLVYLHGPIFGQASWINGVAWSLEVEVQFYLVMPLLAVVFAVRPAWLRRGLLLVAILGFAYGSGLLFRDNLYPRLSMSLLHYLQFFLAGFLLADLFYERSHAGFRRRLSWDGVALLAAASIFVILTRRYDLYYWTPVLIVLLYAGLFLGRMGHFFITRRWLVTIGGMCYTIYLYHFLVIDLLAPYTVQLTNASRSLRFDFLIQCLLLAPCILIVSAVFFLLVEKPCMRLSSRASRRIRYGKPVVGEPAAAQPTS